LHKNRYFDYCYEIANRRDIYVDFYHWSKDAKDFDDALSFKN
jgi:hypothetical protein